MALPATINSVTQIAGNYAPFKSSGGNFYAIAAVTTSAVAMFKSSDPGTVAFAEVDVSGKPQAFNNIAVMSAVQGTDSDADIIYIVTIDAGFFLEFHRFDMGADNWDQTDDQVSNLSGMNAPLSSIMWVDIAYRN